MAKIGRDILYDDSLFMPSYRLTPPVELYVMAGETVIELDAMADWCVQVQLLQVNNLETGAVHG